MSIGGHSTSSREKSTFIVQGSTTAFEKSRQFNAMAPAYILAPRSGITMNADDGRRPSFGLGKRSGRGQRHPAGQRDHDDAGR
jgi:hypothetical protein